MSNINAIYGHSACVWVWWTSIPIGIPNYGIPNHAIGIPNYGIPNHGIGIPTHSLCFNNLIILM